MVGWICICRTCEYRGPTVIGIQYTALFKVYSLISCVYTCRNQQGELSYHLPNLSDTPYSHPCSSDNTNLLCVIVFLHTFSWFHTKWNKSECPGFFRGGKVSCLFHLACNWQWGLVACHSKANKEVRLMERKVWFILDASLSGSRGIRGTCLSKGWLLVNDNQQEQELL